jgi:hypothetical protein
MKTKRDAELRLTAVALTFCSLCSIGLTTRAAFHLWQVKEVFSNADGSVQFVEMFDNGFGETLVGGWTLTANSDGNIQTFKFPSDLTMGTPASLLITTDGFGSLAGGVNPDFTFSQSATPISGSFFNPNATNLSFKFTGSSDTMSFQGATLPKDGIHSLTDAGATGPFPNTPNIGSGANSPTNLSGNSGSVNLSGPSPTGDYNLNHVVDAADYVAWRSTLGGSVTAPGHGADGNGNGTVDAGDYDFWRSKFGNSAGSGSGLGSAISAPEPAAASLTLIAVLLSRLRRRRSP